MRTCGVIPVLLVCLVPRVGCACVELQKLLQREMRLSTWIKTADSLYAQKLSSLSRGRPHIADRGPWARVTPAHIADRRYSGTLRYPAGTSSTKISA